MKIQHFPLGTIVATPGALNALQEAGDNPARYLNRHRRGDWGDLPPGDRQANLQALVSGQRLLSAYHLSNHGRIWIITEADRSATTILLPEEY